MIEDLPQDIDVIIHSAENVQNRPANGRLAAAAFPHQAERLARIEIQIHAIDRTHRCLLAQEYAAVDREVDVQVLDFEDSFHSGYEDIVSIVSV